MKNKKIIKKIMFLIIPISIFLWSLISAGNWNEVIHSGGVHTLKEIIKASLYPDFSKEILKLAIVSTIKTIVYAMTGLSLALFFAFILGTLASGIFFDTKFYKFFSIGSFRFLLSCMRAIHELIWAWFFVAAIGLSPFAAIFAIAISYGGTLGKIFSDLLNDVPKKPLEALKTNGASNIQIFIYGYLPVAIPNMVSYTMYRLECAVRSSTIMSFVGLGGLGYQIHLSLNDLEYNEVWTYIYFLVGLVILIEIWSNKIRGKFSHISNGLFLLMIIISWYFIFNFEKANLGEFFSSKSMFYGKQFLRKLTNIFGEDSAFRDPKILKNTFYLTWDTLKMSILAISLSTISMILVVIPAAKNASTGELTLKKKWYSKILFLFIRGAYIFSRAIPELIWATLIVFILKPGIITGALALALHNFGILGKLCSEVIEDMDLKPIRNLSSSGATTSQLLIYGVFPAVIPKFITYILYRWEVIIRTTIVVGFVGAGGLGQQFKLSMSFFRYTEITLLLLSYLFLVATAEIICIFLRRAVSRI